MPTLQKNFHIIAFAFLLILLTFLQFGPFSIGWPISLGNGRGYHFLQSVARFLVNAVPCMMILSLCMIPFGYDAKRTFSIGSLLLLTFSASMSFLILTPGYLENYQSGERLLVVFLTSLAINGLLNVVWSWLSKNVDLPDWRKRKPRERNELDF